MPFEAQPQYQCTANSSVREHGKDNQCKARAEYKYGPKRLCWVHMKRATAIRGNSVSLKSVLGKRVHKL